MLKGIWSFRSEQYIFEKNKQGFGRPDGNHKEGQQLAQVRQNTVELNHQYRNFLPTTFSVISALK